MEELVAENKLNSKMEALLDQFEREVEPYDRLSGLSMFFTPAGVVISVLVPLALSYIGVISEPVWYWSIAGILATLGLSKLPLFYVDHKKHEISKTKYRPLAGVCMCDLSQYRSHVTKMEKARTTGERIRHAKLANYYKCQMGWK